MALDQLLNGEHGVGVGHVAGETAGVLFGIAGHIAAANMERDVDVAGVVHQRQRVLHTAAKPDGRTGERGARPFVAARGHAARTRRRARW